MTLNVFHSQIHNKLSKHYYMNTKEKDNAF